MLNLLCTKDEHGCSQDRSVYRSRVPFFSSFLGMQKRTTNFLKAGKEKIL